MTDNERLSEWFDTHDGEDYCKYCIYDDECPHGMACYGGPPVEPPCAGNDLKEILDTEEILDDIAREEALKVDE